MEKKVKFQTMGDFHARVNFYSHRDVVNALCKLQGCQMYKVGYELDITLLVRSSMAVSWYRLDYRPARAPLIPSEIPIND